MEVSYAEKKKKDPALGCTLGDTIKWTFCNTSLQYFVTTPFTGNTWRIRRLYTRTCISLGGGYRYSPVQAG